MPSEIERHQLTLSDVRGRPLRLVRFVQPAGSKHLAVIFPGRHYSCDRPVLHFTRRLLLEAGADVIEVNYEHEDLFAGEPSSASLAELGKWLEADARAVLGEAVAGQQLERLTLVGKSLGTRVLAYLASDGRDLLAADDVRMIGYTPLFKDPSVREALIAFDGPALYVIGNHDEHHDPAVAERLHGPAPARLLVIDGADHALESANNLRGTLEDLMVIVNAAYEFIHAEDGR